MKEKPILFSAPMVRAILSGLKSQTRRILKPQPVMRDFVNGQMQNGLMECHHSGGWCRVTPSGMCDCGKKKGEVWNCPYGQPGDILWVKENYWMHDSPYAFASSDGNVTDGDGHRRLVGWSATMDSDSVRIAKDYGCKQRPSIHMYRWASRITLKVTNVRVERLQDINEADAMAEGVFNKSEEKYWDPSRNIHITPNVHDYMQLWDKINGPGSWALNPWVWVVEFERITA